MYVLAFLRHYLLVPHENLELVPHLSPSRFPFTDEAGFRGQGHEGLHVGYRPSFYLPGLPACSAGHRLSFLGAPCEPGVRRSVFQWPV